MWSFVKSGIEGNCVLFGVNIFQYHWEKTNQKITVSDPVYGQKHEINVYHVHLDGRKKTFAAGELSNGVYGFYIEE